MRIHELGSGLIRCMLMAFREFARGPDPSILRREWKEVDALQEKQVSVRSGKETLVGVARGIDSKGSLILRLKNGTLRRLRSAEVTLRK